jgi:hypothetical protein
MDEAWFEDELVPAEETVRQTVKSSRQGPALGGSQADEQIRQSARGVVRVDRPRWGQLSAEDRPLQSGAPARFFVVRLGFQFEVLEDARNQGARFISARCSAFLWPRTVGQAQPTVYDVFPRDLYEGKPQTFKVKLGPKVSVGESVEASLGEVSTDFTIGTVEPSVVGWPGEDERAPYWDLHPKSKSLLGVRHLWLVIEAPPGCDGVRLAAQAEGVVQTHLFGMIPVGPQTTEWGKRPAFVLI